MREYTTARFVIANDTICAVAEETEAAASAEWQRLVADNHVTEEGIDATPRLALVDAPEAPTCWALVDTYYRIRHVGERGANAYHVGPAANIFEEKDAAIEAARSLDDLGDEWDVEVVEFSDVTGSGRVVWGY